jgi:hypothetical protein
MTNVWMTAGYAKRLLGYADGRLPWRATTLGRTPEAG